jgi:fumarate reductase subunit D
MAFGIGGFLVAFFFPVHIFLFGMALPFKWFNTPDYVSALHLLHAPATRIYLGILLIFAFFHAGYRIRDTLCDAFDVRSLDRIILAACFGAALAGSIYTIALLASVPSVRAGIARTAVTASNQQ